MKRIRKIGVMASAVNADANLELMAYKVGETIARYKAVLITGACNGLPLQAVNGAIGEGGLCLGFSPEENLKDHLAKGYPAEGQILIFTGFGRKGRNIISTRSCDAIITIAGRNGTLHEFATYYDEGLGPIGVLVNSGGVSSKLQEIVAGYNKPRATSAPIYYESDSVILVEKIINYLNKEMNYIIKNKKET